MAGFLGPLLLVLLLLGIRLLVPIRVRRSELSVAGILLLGLLRLVGLVRLLRLLLLLCLDRRLRLLWFRSARSRSLWVSFSVLPSFSSTMRIAWVVSSSSSSSLAFASCSSS